MTLDELTAVVRVNLFDRGTGLWADDAALKAKVNDAAALIGGLVASQQGAMMLRRGAWQVANSSGAKILALGESGQGTPLTVPIHRLLTAYLDPTPSGARTVLEIIRYEDLERRMPSAATAEPPVFAWNHTIGALWPADALTINFVYVGRLPRMAAGTDTPGQVNGAGQANLLPEPYHPLVSDWATVLALLAEARDPSGWLAAFQTHAQALGLDAPLTAKVSGEG